MHETLLQMQISNADAPPSSDSAINKVHEKMRGKSMLKAHYFLNNAYDCVIISNGQVFIHLSQDDRIKFASKNPDLPDWQETYHEEADGASKSEIEEWMGDAAVASTDESGNFQIHQPIEWEKANSEE